jgi:hypothetical protein
MTSRNDVRILVGTIDSVTAEISRRNPWMRRTVRLETDDGLMVVEVGREYDDVQFVIGSPAALPVQLVNGIIAGEQLRFAWKLDEEVDAGDLLEAEYGTVAADHDGVPADSVEREYATVAA